MLILAIVMNLIIKFFLYLIKLVPAATILTQNSTIIKFLLNLLKLVTATVIILII